MNDFEFENQKKITFTCNTPLDHVVGSVFTCELHVMKMIAPKLKINLKEVKLINVDAGFNMAGIQGIEG